MLEIGKCYYVRTITDHWVGRVSAIMANCVTLEDASWIADSGRLSDFVRDGKTDTMEIEPVGRVCCHWLTCIPWTHELFNNPI